MTVRYTSAADADLGAIYLVGFETYGARRAEAYVAGLRGAVQMIADFPLACRLRENVQPPIRVRSFRSHVIIYTVDEAGVLILRFRHGLEDWQEDAIKGGEDTP